jgi:hypothetical protein
VPAGTIQVLNDPPVVLASEAEAYLRGDAIVMALVSGVQARAYPQGMMLRPARQRHAGRGPIARRATQGSLFHGGPVIKPWHSTSVDCFWITCWSWLTGRLVRSGHKPG